VAFAILDACYAKPLQDSGELQVTLKNWKMI